MDAINRRIATETLLEFASEAGNMDRQYVLLTPQVGGLVCWPGRRLVDKFTYGSVLLCHDLFWHGHRCALPKALPCGSWDGQNLNLKPWQCPQLSP